MTIQTPFFIQILADGNLQPGAVWLQPGKSGIEPLLPFFQDPSFHEFTEELPCLADQKLADGLTQESMAAFRDAGCAFVPATLVQHTDAAIKPFLNSPAQWFSGDWYLAPPPKKMNGQAASRVLSLKLLHLVATDADTCEIETIFRQDPVLAYHLLRLVNSIGVGATRHISSFSQAILILGRQQLKRWLNLMLFAANRDDYRCAMLLARVTVRARLMELLANAAGLDRSMQEQAFMSGMFSLLGILFGMPLSEIMTPLKLGDALTSAVLRREGELGFLLQASEKLENADESVMQELQSRIGVNMTSCNRIVLEAHKWMLAVVQNKQETADA